MGQTDLSGECQKTTALMKEISFSLRRIAIHLGYTIPHLSILGDLMVMAHRLDSQAERLEGATEFDRAWALSLDRAKQALASE